MKADAYVGDMSAINYAHEPMDLRNCDFQGNRISSQHRFAFPKSNQELASIMTKAMSSISSEEADIIYSRWLGMRIEHGIHADTLLKYGIGVALLFLLFLILVL